MYNFNWFKISILIVWQGVDWRREAKKIWSNRIDLVEKEKEDLQLQNHGSELIFQQLLFWEVFCTKKKLKISILRGRKGGSSFLQF
jgi:hypothetical protein